MNEAAEIVRRHLNDDVHTLAAQSHWFEPFDKMMLLRQIQSRQKAKSKLPSWYGNFDLLFPAPLSVEQCSSELTAEYKAGLVSGKLLVDMTGGMGIDSSFFVRRMEKVIFFEQQEALAQIAKSNFNILKISNIKVLCEDSTTQIEQLEKPDWVFLDPARRKEGRKVFLLQDCEPDVLQILPRLWAAGTQNVLLKLSPLFDITQLKRDLPGIRTVHLVAVHNEVKELLAEVQPVPTNNLRIVCVNLESGTEPQKWCRKISAYGAENQPIEKVNDNLSEFPGYLYEPHATVMKSGLMDEYAQQFNLRKLQKNSHLYYSENLSENFFGRIFKIESVFGMGKAELKQGLSGLTRANITTRNFPLKEADLRKKLKLANGGDITLIATTLQNNKHVIFRCAAVS